eukprot:5052688-Ditylum_brightwellii.AAC.2
MDKSMVLDRVENRLLYRGQCGKVVVACDEGKGSDMHCRLNVQLPLAHSGEYVECNLPPGI